MEGDPSNFALAASSADEVDNCEPAVGSPQDSNDGSCFAAKPTEHADVLAAIKKQVEFYFSDANLPTDKHLLKQIQKDPEGYVPLRMIANFKRVKALTKDLGVVAEALKGSTLLSLDESSSCVKRSTPLPAFDVNDIAKRTVVVEHLPDKPTIESVTQLLSQYGEVVMVRICSRGNTNKLPAWLGKAVDAINMTMAPGEFALVEFGSEDDCVTCINKTRNPDNWRTSLRVRHLLPNFKPTHKAGSKGSGPEHGDSKQQSRGHSTGGAADRHHHQGTGVSHSCHGGHSKDMQGGQQQEHGGNDSSAEAAAAIAAATAAAGVLPNLAPIRTISAPAAAVQRAGSPHANGPAVKHDVLGSPVGLSPIKVCSGAANAGAGVGGSIGSPRTVSSPAPPEVSSFIDSILSAPTGNTPTKGGSSSSRWSTAGDWGSSSSNVTPAAAVAAALAGVSTPPQSSSPRHSATGGARGSAAGGAFTSGTGTPTRLSTTTSNVAQLAPTQSALAAQLAAAAAAAAQAAMAGSPKAAQGSSAASWRSSSKPTAAGASISAPNTPLAGLSAGDAVGAALDEEFGDMTAPPRAQAVASPELSSSPKPGPWIPASRLHHMQQAAQDGHNMMRSSGSEAEDNTGSWKRRSWTGQAGSPHGGGMRPPKPRNSGTGAAGASNRPRRPSWHAADTDEVAGKLEMSSEVESNDGAAAEASSNRTRRSRLQQASGDFRSAVDSIKEATAEAGASVAQAMASLSLGGSHQQQQQRRRSSTTGGAAEAREDGEDEHEHEEDDHLGEGTSSGKSRRRRHKRSSTGSRRASLDETGAGRHTSTDEGPGKSGGKRQSEDGGGSSGGRHRRHSLDEGSGSKPNSRPHSRAGALSPEDPSEHRPSSGGNRSHSGGSQAAEHHGAAKDSKKKEKKDYASWAAATPEFRAAAAKHSSGGGAAPSANMLGTSPSRAGQSGISPLRASMGGAPGGHHDSDSHVRIARMPDGTRGFGMGRGRPVTPSAP
eukprot:GHUV01000888.1.p1 GENE.GHUV01000888.1~~GHUV01000888.1.p1  ORF type:complete len:994 (+),score=425.46 GHUV01000888.1:1363-4344(+)